MAAIATCEKCGYAFEVDEQHLGKPVQFTCPECNTRQTVTPEEKKKGSVVWDDVEQQDERKPGVVFDEEEPEEPARPSVIFGEPAETAPPATDPATAPAEPGLELEPDKGTEPPGPPEEPGRPAPDTTPAEAAVELEVEEEGPAEVSFPELEGSGRYELEDVPGTSRPRPDEADEPPGEPRFFEDTGGFDEPDVAQEEELLQPEIMDEPGTPPERLEAELAAIDKRLEQIRREMGGTGAWNMEDAKAVLEMPMEGWKARLRRWWRLLVDRKRGHNVPCRIGYDGSPSTVTPSRVREYNDLDVRRQVLGGLADSRGVLPPVLLFAGPGLLAWLSLLAMVLVAQAVTTFSAAFGTGVLVVAPLVAVVLYRVKFLPLRQALKQYPLWQPRGFTAPGRGSYKMLCMLVIAAVCLIVTLIIAHNLVVKQAASDTAVDTNPAASTPTGTDPGGAPDRATTPEE